MKKQLLIIICMFLLVGIVSAESFVFQENEFVNYRFRCLDENNAYCNSATQCQISIENPEGINVYDNSSMTWNETFFNHTLPTENTGEYVSIIICSSDNATSSEFTYSVTPTGRVAPTDGEGIIYIGTLLAMVLFSIFFFMLSLQFKPSKDAQQNEDGSYNPIPNDKPALRFGCLALSFIVGFIVLLYAMVSMQNVFYGFEKIIDSYYIFMWLMGFIFIIIFIFVLITLLIQAVDSLRAKRGLKNV